MKKVTIIYSDILFRYRDIELYRVVKPQMAMTPSKRKQTTNQGLYNREQHSSWAPVCRLNKSLTANSCKSLGHQPLTQICRSHNGALLDRKLFYLSQYCHFFFDKATPYIKNMNLKTQTLTTVTDTFYMNEPHTLVFTSEKSTMS